MSRYDHLRIFKSAYELCLLTYRLTHNFGKDHRYTLGERMKCVVHDMLDLLIETNSATDAKKPEFLDVFSMKIERFRMYARISCDLKVITPGSLGKAEELLEDIETQAVAWRAWAKEQR
jgi:hypothetical protein